MNKQSLTETDIRTKFISPAIVGPDNSGWDVTTQILEEYHFTKSRVVVHGKTVKRDVPAKGDNVLLYKPNLSLSPTTPAKLSARPTLRSIPSSVPGATPPASRPRKRSSSPPA